VPAGAGTAAEQPAPSGPVSSDPATGLGAATARSTAQPAESGAQRREWRQIPRYEPAPSTPRPRPARPPFPRESFAGPRLHARTSPLRRARSVIVLGIIVLVVALVVAGILAAVVAGIAIGVHHASSGG
jgi:hypothetical protein